MTLPAYAMNLSSFPEMYEHWLVGPLFRPWAELLLERAELAAGDEVLDIACGTGIVARLAQERLGGKGRVVGVDVSAQMLSVARAIAPDVDWREGDASALPVDGAEKFDVVTCQQGLQFFSEKPAAAREMRRVIAPGGRLVVATWRPLEENALFRDLHEVAERRLGAIADQRHGFADAAALQQLLADAGFRDIRLETMSLTIHMPDAATFLRMNTMALVGMSSLATAAIGDEERSRIVTAIMDDSAEALAAYQEGEGLAFEMRSNVAKARPRPTA